MTEARLGTHVAAYRNTAEGNERIFHHFARKTDSVPFLKEHRDWVEENDDLIPLGSVMPGDGVAPAPRPRFIYTPS